MAYRGSYQKLDISGFVQFLQRQLADGAGYIMGATGQTLTRKLLERFANYQSDYSPSRYIELGGRWIGRRCFDCNGLAEGYYQDTTGVNIDSKARFNFAQWCDGANGSDMRDMPRLPGVAVFIYSVQKGYITHVGFLEKPVNPDNVNGDWHVIEARGVNYGVVRTRLNSRSTPWNRWGLMLKYFTYPEYTAKAFELGDRTLRSGMNGGDVRALQDALISLGYSCGAYGVDGDFGPATRAALVSFQRDEDIDDDGVFGAISHQALLSRLDNDLPETPDEAPGNADTPHVTVTGNSVNLRHGPGVDWPIMDVVHKGDKLEPLDIENWLPVKSNDTGLALWISRKYVELGR